LTIEAFAKVVQRFPDAQLDLVGDGELEGRCRTLIQKNGLGERVHIHGAQGPDFIASLLREASLFVQHSVSASDGDAEGLPVAILEAMASALPIVSTKHGGIPEAVVHNVTGRLVEEYDVDGMAAAISELFDHPELAERMGAAGRKRVLGRFNHKKAKDQLRAIMGFNSSLIEITDLA